MPLKIDTVKFMRSGTFIRASTPVDDATILPEREQRAQRELTVGEVFGPRIEILPRPESGGVHLRNVVGRVAIPIDALEAAESTVSMLSTQ